MSDRYLSVDPIKCSGQGLCAEIIPEAVTLDDWGFPMIAAGPVPPRLHRLARKARAACPALALRFDADPGRRPPSAANR